MDDIYQTRYTRHQEDKREQLASCYGLDKPNLSPSFITYLDAISNHRASQRNFNRQPVSFAELQYILNIAGHSPSSCDRHATRIKIVEDRNTKQLLGGILVGGAGWIHRADKIILLLADETAYKENLDFMKYLDAGFVGMNIYMACEVQGIGACFVNPNIRDEHKHIFRDIVPEENLVLCGAMPIGHFDKHPEVKESIGLDILYEDIKSEGQKEEKQSADCDSKLQ